MASYGIEVCGLGIGGLGLFAGEGLRSYREGGMKTGGYIRERARGVQAEYSRRVNCSVGMV